MQAYRTNDLWPWPQINRISCKVLIGFAGNAGAARSVHTVRRQFADQAERDHLQGEVSDCETNRYRLCAAYEVHEIRILALRQRRRVDGGVQEHLQPDDRRAQLGGAVQTQQGQRWPLREGEEDQEG